MSNATERSKKINVAMPVGIESRWLAMFHRAISVLWKILKSEGDMCLGNPNPWSKYYFSLSVPKIKKKNSSKGKIIDLKCKY